MSQATRPYLTNDLGDVYASVEAGVQIEVDPTSWGWLRRGGANDLRSKARSLTELGQLPGFSVSAPEPWESFVPGPKPVSARWNRWDRGAAPAAAVESAGGTRAYFDRVSEAAAYVAVTLTPRIANDTMYVYDFYQGHLYTVDFRPRTAHQSGKGIVYLVADTNGRDDLESAGLKVGYTSRTVANRIVGLQVGNPRTIHVIAEIINVTETDEYALHADLERWHMSGEWFSYAHVEAYLLGAGGIEAWVRKVLKGQKPEVELHHQFGHLGHSR